MWWLSPKTDESKFIRNGESNRKWYAILDANAPEHASIGIERMLWTICSA